MSDEIHRLKKAKNAAEEQGVLNANPESTRFHEPRRDYKFSIEEYMT